MEILVYTSMTTLMLCMLCCLTFTLMRTKQKKECSLEPVVREKERSHQLATGKRG